MYIIISEIVDCVFYNKMYANVVDDEDQLSARSHYVCLPWRYIFIMRFCWFVCLFICYCFIFRYTHSQFIGIGCMRWTNWWQIMFDSSIKRSIDIRMCRCLYATRRATWTNAWPIDDYRQNLVTNCERWNVPLVFSVQNQFCYCCLLFNLCDRKTLTNCIAHRCWISISFDGRQLINSQLTINIFVWDRVWLRVNKSNCDACHVIAMSCVVEHAWVALGSNKRWIYEQHKKQGPSSEYY